MTSDAKTPEQEGWLASSFVAPDRVELHRLDLHVRPIHPDDTEIDMIAVMGSRDRLWSIYGQAWGWPPADLTADADREDLALRSPGGWSMSTSTDRSNWRSTSSYLDGLPPIGPSMHPAS